MAGGIQLGYTRLTERATALGAAAVMPWFGGAVGVSVQALDYEAGTLPVLGDLWPGDGTSGSQFRWRRAASGNRQRRHRDPLSSQGASRGPSLKPEIWTCG